LLFSWLIRSWQSEIYKHPKPNYHQFSVNIFFGKNSASMFSRTKEQQIAIVNLKSRLTRQRVHLISRGSGTRVALISKINTVSCHAMRRRRGSSRSTRAVKGGGFARKFLVRTFKSLSCTFKPSSFEAGPPSATLETTIPPASELLLPTW